jgi:signal peptidase
MSHTLEKGDLIFFKQTDKVDKDDVIVFKSDDIRIVHRIVAVKNINNEVRYYTKGDANMKQDDGYITKDKLMGKVLFKIKYLGRPTLWLNEAFK